MSSRFKGFFAPFLNIGKRMNNSRKAKGKKEKQMLDLLLGWVEHANGASFSAPRIETEELLTEYGIDFPPAKYGSGNSDHNNTKPS